jgi:hypothetical protein
MNYQDISNDICLLVEEMNTWSSTITIPQDEGYLNISSAAMGKLSTVPIGAYNQPSTFPKGRSASFFRFDPKIFHENSWPMLTDVLTKVGCVSGCRLAVSHCLIKKTCNRLATYTLRCTHGFVYKSSGASTFEEGNIGPSNVVTEFIKRVKTKGAMKGNEYTVPLYEFTFMISFILIYIYDFACSNFLLDIRNGLHEI